MPEPSLRGPDFIPEDVKPPSRVTPCAMARVSAVRCRRPFAQTSTRVLVFSHPQRRSTGTHRQRVAGHTCVAVFVYRLHTEHAVSDEIKRLSDALGGVNALYNVHLGAVRLETQGLREAVLLLTQQIEAKIIVLEPVTLPEPTALATQERRQAD